MSTTSKLASQIQRIATAWPADPLRPHLQLKNFFTALEKHPSLTPQALNAAQTLLENGVTRKYPLSDKMLKPTSQPHHYERLNEGFEKSVQGIKRPWWKIFFNVW